MTTTGPAATVTAPPPTVVAGPPGRAAPVSTWLRTHRGLVVLLAIPVVAFGLPQLVGWSFLDGDNFLQNFPMRVLVGRDLDHGVLPLWNPYLFSGTPLLGGFNAGAAYPATWLMAALPIFTAWTLNLVLAYDVAVGGMYLFLRRQSVSTLGATFGAATFGFAGYMTAQIVHIDLIEGAAWLPWMLVAVHALTGRTGADPAGVASRPSGAATRRWVGLLAVALGLSLLSGSAEAIIDSAVLVAVYLVGRLVTGGYLTRAALWDLARTLTAVVAAVAVGVALSAAQWLPGLEFLGHSQRADVTYDYFTSGSLSARLVTLIASPFVLGTDQGQPGPYVGSYNFNEVTSYVGVLALIALFSLFLRRYRTRPEARHWWIWYVIAGVGLVSALGNQTPFGHVLYLIPGINSERLINRNLLMVDFSLSVLLAWWVHVLFESRGHDPGAGDTVRRRWRSGHRAEIVATCVPLAFAAAVCLSLWVAGPQLHEWLKTQYPETTATRVHVALLVTAGTLVAGWATWVVLHQGRMETARLRRLLTAVLVVDLVLFDCFVIRPPVSEARAQAQGPFSSALDRQVGDARFIVYDPDEIVSNQLYDLGQTDLNIYAALPSGQGYTALTDGQYFDATGAHFQEDLNPATLADSTWDNLNVSTLVSLPGYFLTPLPSSPAPTAAPGDAVRFPADIHQYNSSPTPVADSYTLAPGHSRTWYFGAALTADSFDIPVPDGRPGDLRVGLVTPTGGTRWLPAPDTVVTRTGPDPSVRVALPTPTRAAGLVVRAGGTGEGAVTVGTPTGVTAQTGGVALNGRMQYGVTPPHWRYTGMIGSFGVFSNSDAKGWAWLRGPGGGEPAPGATVAAPAPDGNGGQVMTARVTSAALLVRSESWSTGWRATVQPLSGPSGHPAGPAREAPVVQVGITQGVELPAAGVYTVTFTYLTSSARRGLVVSGVTAVALVVWFVLDVVVRRRRGRAGRGPDPGPTPG